MKKLIAVLICVLLGSCGGRVKELTCTGNDWFDMGYKTATKGESIRFFNRYIDSCGQNLEKDSKEVYIAGYRKGIVEYCSYDKGFQLGSANIKVDTVCPYELRPDFDKGYKVGLLDYKNKMSGLRKVMDEAENTENAVEAGKPEVRGPENI